MDNLEKVVFANAKINLALHIVGKREDGYHFLDSLVVFPDITDKLIINESKNFKFTISGEFSRLVNEKDNSVIKALTLIKDQLRSNFSIHLEKNIPIGAGLGGGSADAAAILRYFKKHYKINTPSYKRISAIGADVPVCLSKRFQRVRGIGECVEVLSKNQLKIWIVLVNPGINVSTGKIFKSLTNINNQGLENLKNFDKAKDFVDYLLRQRNDLQKVACEKYPEIQHVLNEIFSTRNNFLTRMTGSGSTCYGLYLSKKDALDADSYLTNKFRNWWIKHSRIF